MGQAQRKIGGLEAPATVALVVLNLLVYMVTVYQGGGIGQPGGKLFLDGALIGAGAALGSQYELIDRYAQYLDYAVYAVLGILLLLLVGRAVRRRAQRGRDAR